jgi:UDP-glucuronate decarboxylase
MSRKKVLVTGGAGFIGTHLCKRLLGEGCEVVCLDNLYTGSLENVSALSGSAAFQFVRHDVKQPYYFEVDEIYNLACPASPVHYQADPIGTTETSVLGAIHALELAKKIKARVLQASTSEVYGDPKEHPQKETYWGSVNPVGIRSCYDEGKRCAETLFFDYFRQNGVDIKVIRIFNTYGPQMHPADGRVVSNFIMQALQNQAITIYGNGQQTRSFCYVSDLVDGMMRMMASEAAFQGPVNLGNPVEFTMLELAEEILQQTKSASQLVFQPLPQDDPCQRRPDISLAKEKLGWTPTIPLREGLMPTIEWFRRQIPS